MEKVKNEKELEKKVVGEEKELEEEKELRKEKITTAKLILREKTKYSDSYHVLEVYLTESCKKAFRLNASEVEILQRLGKKELKAKIVQLIGKNTGNPYYRVYMIFNENATNQYRNYTKFGDLDYEDLVVVNMVYDDFFNA